MFNTTGWRLFFWQYFFKGKLPVRETLEFASAPPGHQTPTSASRLGGPIAHCDVTTPAPGSFPRAGEPTSRHVE